jgi:hypothetical protein
LNCVFLMGYYVTTFDMTVLNYAALSLAIEFVLAIWQIIVAGAMDRSMLSALSSQVLHLMGAAAGFGFGVAAVRRKWVDCENWDLFSVMKDRHRLNRDQLAEEALNSPEAQAKREDLRRFMLEQLHNFVSAGEHAAALAVHRRGTTRYADWRLPDDDHVQLIALLRKTARWDDAVQIMVEYLRAAGPRAPVVRLALAQILLQQLGRPLQAVKVLAKVDPAQLPAAQQPVLAALRQQAIRAAEEDPFEVVADDW